MDMTKKVLMFLGILVVLLLLLFFGLKNKEALFGKAIDGQTFNINVDCDNLVEPNSSIHCDLVLTPSLNTGHFGAQFVINAPGLTGIGSGVAGINFTVYSPIQGNSGGLGGQTLFYKNTNDGQAAGVLASFDLIASASEGDYPVYLTDLILVDNSIATLVTVALSNGSINTTNTSTTNTTGTNTTSTNITNTSTGGSGGSGGGSGGSSSGSGSGSSSSGSGTTTTTDTTTQDTTEDTVEETPTPPRTTTPPVADKVEKKTASRNFSGLIKWGLVAIFIIIAVVIFLHHRRKLKRRYQLSENIK